MRRRADYFNLHTGKRGPRADRMIGSHGARHEGKGKQEKRGEVADLAHGPRQRKCQGLVTASFRGEKGDQPKGSPDPRDPKKNSLRRREKGTARK